MTWRTAATVAAAGFVLLYPVYDLLDQAITHGITQRGDLLVVNMKAMSNFNLDQSNGNTTDIPLPYRQLDGKRVMLAGEMWVPTSSGGPLDQFQLVYSINSCCFNGPPRVQHFVKATVEPGKQVEYSQGVVNVVGTLHVGVEREGGQIDSVYRMDVEKVED
jgi:hypothetical protein